MKPVIPVVAFQGEEQAVRALSALSEGGLHLAEITFRTPYAEAALRLAAARFPKIVVGAGSVVTCEQAERALQSGAKFVVSPGFSAKIAAFCAKSGISYLPGAVTPTEIMSALDAGISTVKFFPAEVYGGLNAVKALAAPFPQVKFVPTGGVNFSNLGEYLSCDRVAAVGGSFMMQGDIVANCRRIAALREA